MTDGSAAHAASAIIETTLKAAIAEHIAHSCPRGHTSRQSHVSPSRATSFTPARIKTLAGPPDVEETPESVSRSKLVPKLLIDPYDSTMTQLTPHLDPESRKHVWRWLNLDVWLTEEGISTPVHPGSTYTVSLFLEHAVMGHWFAAVSSRNLDKSASNSLAVRNHASILRTVNNSLSRSQPRTDYNGILLGIQGAMASAYIGGNLDEFELHRQGRARFLRTFGLSTDPNVTLLVTQNSLNFGRSMVGRNLNGAAPSAASQADEAAEKREIQAAADNFVDLLHVVYRRSHYKLPHELLNARSQSERELFSTGSTLSNILHSPLTDDIHIPYWNPWGDVHTLAHHPYLVIYLTLLHCDLIRRPSEIQEETWKSIQSTIHSLPTASSVFANGYTLFQFRHDTSRAWRASHLLWVLLRLSPLRSQSILRSLVWYLTLSGSRPFFEMPDLRVFLNELELGSLSYVYECDDSP